MSETKNVSYFVQKHFVSATNVPQFACARKRHEQQCFRNNVSSFARAFNLGVVKKKPNGFCPYINLSQIKLIFGPLVIQLVWRMFTSNSVDNC